MIRVKVLLDDTCQSHRPIPPDQFSEFLAANRHGLLWIDVANPTSEDFALLEEEFGFHPLALEDARKQHQRPKIDEYDGYLFITFYRLDDSATPPEPVEIDIFAGVNYLVTIRTGESPEIEATSERWCQHAELLGQRGVGFLLYSLMDVIVDGYFPILDALYEQFEVLEERIFERNDRTVQRDIFAQRRHLIGLRKVIAPERDVLNVLVRRDTPLLGNDASVYFQDVYDHVLRVTDGLDSFRELLSGALEASLSASSNHLNKIMKTLTASSIVLMSMTLVASVYGMNFDRMPELDWALGYPLALGLMAMIGGVLIAIFRRIDWF
jgi:magnesium transporter